MRPGPPAGGQSADSGQAPIAWPSQRGAGAAGAAAGAREAGGPRGRRDRSVAKGWPGACPEAGGEMAGQEGPPTARGARAAPSWPRVSPWQIMFTRQGNLARAIVRTI